MVLGFTSLENRLIYAGMANKKTSTDQTESAVASGGGTDVSFEDLLVDVGRNRNKESFILLFEYFAPRIKSFLMKGGANENSADELAQETMLSVWNKAKSFDPQKAAASTWIFTIARNKRIDAIRKKKAYNVDLDDLPLLEDEKALTPAQSTLLKEQAEGIAGVLKKLPDAQAELIRKSFFEDKSHKEIAEETGIPLGTVKSRIRLALERLRGEDMVKKLWQ